MVVIANISIIRIITYILCPYPSHVPVPVEIASLLPSWWRTLPLPAGFTHHASILWLLLLLLLLGGSHLALLGLLLITISLFLLAIVLLVAVALVIIKRAFSG